MLEEFKTELSAGYRYLKLGTRQTQIAAWPWPRRLAQYLPRAECRLRLPPRHVCASTVAVAFDDCHYNYHRRRRPAAD